ncbi:hypothetical protein PsYK624_070700 [Phanerochaete sordida]|uniref:BTB domain-containing protein n=1 Tax=Phanerochaete sordida TaxID=48140 RepID=A0A9P3G9R7_9APHY|nr:hypothetical protein PsYK624_070700 [Phanerochaete sordida]
MPTQLVYAREPFNSDDRADLIFRTRDGVHFLVHKQIIMTWSPYWEMQLLALEQEEAETWRRKLQYDSAGNPIIPVEEDSATLDALLRHVYPGDAPAPEGFAEAFALLAAARKYEVTTVVKLAKRSVAGLADTNPLRVYALAAARGWDHEMRTAARAALGHPMLPELYAQELEDLHAGTYFRLLAYHRACVKEVVARTADLHWVEVLAAERGWQPQMGRCQIEGCGGAWFGKHLVAVRKALRARPRAKTLDDPQLLSAALGGAMVCGVCRSTAYHDLQMFNALLAEEINRVLEGIELEIK